MYREEAYSFLVIGNKYLTNMFSASHTLHSIEADWSVVENQVFCHSSAVDHQHCRFSLAADGKDKKDLW